MSNANSWAPSRPAGWGFWAWCAASCGQGKECAEDNDSFVLDAVTRMNDYIVSNCSISQMDDLFEKAMSYEFDEIRTLEGESVKGDQYMEFHYDPDALKELIVELCYTEKK